MTGAEIMAVVGFFLMVSGVLWGIWWKIEGRVKEVRTDLSMTILATSAKAELAMMQLQEHRLHIAETYVTKAGMHEQTSTIMRAIEGVVARIDGLNDRLDRMYEQKPPR